MFLDRNKMQSLAMLRILKPGLPGREKRQAKAESRLEHGERTPAAPALRQPVAAQENVPHLRRTALGAVIDVAVGFRVRRAVRRERGTCGNQWRGRAHVAHAAASILTSRCGFGSTMLRLRQASRIAWCNSAPT